MSADITLLESDVETSLRSTVREMLADRCDPNAVLSAYEGDRALTASLWKTVAVELGLAGLVIPDERGGAGASVREAAVVLEELGRAVAPVPFLSSAVEAAIVLREGNSALVEQVASGERTAALLAPFSTAPDADLPRMSVDGNERLSGRVTSVAGALESDTLLVAADTVEGTAVYALRTSDVAVASFVSLDMTRPLADITVDSVPGEVVVPPNSGEAAFRRALRAGAALLASEQVGVTAWCLESTIAHLKERKQFGRTVGGFQALKHRLADLFVEAESASAAARYAAGALAADSDDAAIATAVASSYCAEVAVHAAEEAVQLHGGTGMTWEHPAHLYLKRAKADEIGRGSPGHHRRVLADLVDIPAS
ncbi:acyl-CoA dehydrogenase [Allosaccharopolyspora coralli]|uniref:Acyl-CoA dehydrogenase n=1 Tax=Allosaccharopolyspora coralli TaxID=2665642 RepID=A0A5Q3QDY2_9PSEU|nr:acyl-CoA dehydrogenase family protein [Allosaccharopolyspora coralli]QGK68997.1 acyl-CoA dehydrogenase [Allosaccharopolyspora coralli]